MTTEQITMLRAVAEGLRWEDYSSAHFPHFRNADDTFSIFFTSDYNKPANHVYLLAFAAYVMAEMAKRGWVIEPSDLSVGFMMAYDNRGEPKLSDYDPTDPVSWAWAVIRCAYDALGVEGDR